jgi:hypothetical protein
MGTVVLTCCHLINDYKAREVVIVRAALGSVPGRPDATGIFYIPRAKKGNGMKNMIKTTTIWSLLVIACLLIGACGGGTENFVQGNGKITVIAKDSGGTLLANVKIDVHVDSATGRIVDTSTTDATGTHDFQETVGSDYFFTFTDLTTPARFASPQNWPSRITPLLTATVTLNATLI